MPVREMPSRLPVPKMLPRGRGISDWPLREDGEYGADILYILMDSDTNTGTCPEK